MDLIAFLNRRKTLFNSGDTAGLNALEHEALFYIKEFLSDKISAETDTAPLFYSFFRTFSQTENTQLKDACEKALQKLHPFLNRFDEENRLTRLDDLNKETAEYNLTALSAFERLNPFELKEKDRLKFPVFSDLFRLVNNIEITDSNGQNNASAHVQFIDTLIESARLQTFMKLSIYTDKITEDLYLSDLRQNMEIGLVSMFITDRVPTDMPDDKTKDQLLLEYQKLLNSI